MEDLLPRIEFGDDVLSNLNSAVRLEWVVTNGLGGYASSTVLGMNTRKYHGILVAAFNPPVNRRVMLSKLDEQLLAEDKVRCLGANEFGNGMSPQSYVHIKNFSQSPFPTLTYREGELELRKTILMPHQRNATIIFYEVLSPSHATLQIFPLANFRHFHTVTDKDRLGRNFLQKAAAQKTILRADAQATMILSSNLGRYVSEEDKWVEGIFFRIDSAQGTESLDDCYVPGRFEIDLKPSERARFCIVAVADRDEEVAENIHSSLLQELRNPTDFYRKELGRSASLLQHFQNTYPDVVLESWLKWLVLASDSFIVRRLSTNTETVIAGYHWFEDWGRDSLISLPGLTLVTGRFGDAREILLTFKHYLKNGVIPNRFPDEADYEPAYNTVDATLWFFNAVLQYLKHSGDFDFVHRELWASLQSVIDYHIQGTINNIRLDNDGLISHGPQLTWMDAMIDNNPVTPREGKAVEIQALWYNALKTMELLATRFEENSLAEKYRKMSEKARNSFVEEFWGNQRSCLFDVVNGEAKDESLRPNQIFAVSLDFSMLDGLKKEAVVSVVQDKLWMPFGIRTLSSEDPKYQGRYSGNWAARNYAYHNGTAWAWLLGPFITAFLRTKGFDEESRRFAFENFLQSFLEEETLQAGVGTISEVFDGDPPHSPGGCISQAWSVAEPLRAYVEDILLKRPSFERNVLEGYSNRETK